MTLFGCMNINKISNIVVIGQALDDKSGAIVITSNDSLIYCIDGLNSWDGKIYGRIVKVSGKLLIEELKGDNELRGGIVPQQLIGKKRTILNPKWELVE
jgi:hypothetical protein